ncbi:alpha-acetolactate decarboxylase [Microtetraspora sp. NBRC 13810]|uniref:acetolactate decarboxylase n=1 Tax=Microtetraspora sp. NBRC 13810 TaxID=3030990 RepID=UPI0024A10F61|nr:acetolactate decarboxylase [Microtetraspora sp. NBRC 13810]GLW06963.1 alpha-acetolactate decarboxylase [Microtetraspora sp. NBRC 13810]
MKEPAARDRFGAWVRTVLAHHHGGGGDPDVSRVIYQTSTIGALLDGIYVGDVTVAELLTHGDFGLGTFNRLDGEMVVLDGVCHHLRSDGRATVAAPGERTPFAVVTGFRPETRLSVTSPAGRDAVVALIDRAVGTNNLIQAVRIDGTFARMRTRTVMAQTPPYPPLTRATENEPVTDLTGVTGTLAGFRTPDYEQGISVAGYHLHFLDASHRRGGHALDFELAHGEIAVGSSSELHLSLPRTEAFLNARLSLENIAAHVRKAEGG